MTKNIILLSKKESIICKLRFCRKSVRLETLLLECSLIECCCNGRSRSYRNNEKKKTRHQLPIDLFRKHIKNCTRNSAHLRHRNRPSSGSISRHLVPLIFVVMVMHLTLIDGLAIISPRLRRSCGPRIAIVRQQLRRPMLSTSISGTRIMATSSRELRFNGSSIDQNVSRKRGLNNESDDNDNIELFYAEVAASTTTSTPQAGSTISKNQHKYQESIRAAAGAVSMAFDPVATELEPVLLGGTKTSPNPNVLSMTGSQKTTALLATNPFAESFSTTTRRYYSRTNDDDNESTSSSSFEEESMQSKNTPSSTKGYGFFLPLTNEERELFNLLRRVRDETQLDTTLRVAGGWVRDKLLATPNFQDSPTHDVMRLTSKFHKRTSMVSMGRKGTKVIMDINNLNTPVDIDIALDDMLGREFADHLNEYLSGHGQNTVSVGVVLKNPEKSKHLETATMKVNSFWIDFVNLRAEEYTKESRIPDLMRIGTPSEDAFRRDLTINSLFYNINSGLVEDWTGRGFDDLRRGIVATPVAPLTTLLDDPLRVLRSIRFAARLRFTMDNELVSAAKDTRVRTALAQKVSRERIGSEIDLMLRSPDPVGAMRLLINLKLVNTVFPIQQYLLTDDTDTDVSDTSSMLFDKGLALLSTTHDHLWDCKISPPVWFTRKEKYDTGEIGLNDDNESRRLLWYAAFIKPLNDYALVIREQSSSIPKQTTKKANRSIIYKTLVDELKRPSRDVEGVEKIVRAANDFTQLINSGSDVSASLILMSDICVLYKNNEDGAKESSDNQVNCFMAGRRVDTATENDPLWEHAMEFRSTCSKILKQIGPLWKAALILSLSEQLLFVENDSENAIGDDVIDETREERRRGIIEDYDTFATAMQQVGIIGVWESKPLLNGEGIKSILPKIPQGPVFREVMIEQGSWMTSHPGGSVEDMICHLKTEYPDFTTDSDVGSIKKDCTATATITRNQKDN